MDKRKLLRFEIGFFVFYFLLLQLFTDLQYILEYGNANFLDTVAQRLTTMPLVALPYFFYYKFQVPLLFQKRYIRFFLSVLLFILFLECYLHVIDWWTYHNPFISEKARQSGKSILEKPPFPRQMLALTISYLLTLTGLGYFVKKIEDEMKLRKLKEQHLQLELDYLKAQLHPHFFFNTLNNIYCLALDSSPQTAATVAKLADLMRYIIYDGNKQTVPLKKEIGFIQNYIDLERIRHNDKKQITFSLKGEANGIMITPLLFIPLIENAFKHGINNALTNACFNAELHIENETVRLWVQNSKDKHYVTNNGGMGLENTRRRLQLLYPGKHALVLTDEETYFSAELKVHLK